MMQMVPVAIEHQLVLNGISMDKKLVTNDDDGSQWLSLSGWHKDIVKLVRGKDGSKDSMAQSPAFTKLKRMRNVHLGLEENETPAADQLFEDENKTLLEKAAKKRKKAADAARRAEFKKLHASQDTSVTIALPQGQLRVALPSKDFTNDVQVLVDADNLAVCLSFLREEGLDADSRSYVRSGKFVKK